MKGLEFNMLVTSGATFNRSTVPEPGSSALSLVAAMLFCAVHRRAQRR